MAHESAKIRRCNEYLPRNTILWAKLNVDKRSGVVDCYYHRRGTDKYLWVEYKAEESLRRKVSVTALQEDWLIAVGGIVIMLTPKGHGIYLNEQQWNNKNPALILPTYRAVAEYICERLGVPNALQEKPERPVQNGRLRSRHREHKTWNL